MENKKYIFKFECGDKLPFIGNRHYTEIKKVKLIEDIVAENIPEADKAAYKTKEIEFHDSYFGSYCIEDYTDRQKEVGEFFRLHLEFFVHCTRNNCGDSVDEKVYMPPGKVYLKDIKVKVELDHHCEYQIALSIKDNEWIILPRSSLFNKNLDLKKYYHKNLTLEQGELFISRPSAHPHSYYYIPKIMHVQEEGCKLVSNSIPVYISNKFLALTPIQYDDSSHNIDLKHGHTGTVDLSNYRLVIEKKR